MANLVTDPELLAQLEGGGRKPVTDPAVLAQLNAGGAPSTGEDVAKSLGIGAVKGTTGLVGLTSDVAGLAKYGAGKLGIELPGADNPLVRAVTDNPTVGPAIKALGSIPGSAEIQRKIEGYTGPFYKPKTTAGEYAQTVGEFLPAAAAGPGGATARIATAITGGLGSEAAGKFVKNNTQLGPGFETAGRIAGALAGTAAPAALARTVTPLPASAAKREAVGVLREAGIEPTAGQATGRKGLQYFEAERGGPAAAAASERTGEQFTSAMLREAGENAPRATPEVMTGMHNRITGQFRDLSARNQMMFDQQFANDVSDVARQHWRRLPTDQRKIVHSYVDDLINAAQHPPGGISMLPGDIYQGTRSNLSRHANAVRNSDPQMSQSLRGLRNALDDAMDRSITLMNPADAGAWQEARRQYGNMQSIVRGAGAAGENAALGIISPQQMRTAIASGNNRGAYVRGQGDLSEVVRAGNAVLQPLPNSGTPGRMMAQNLGAGVSSAVGALLGSSTAGPLGGAGGAIAGAMLPAAVGRAAMSRPGQAYLGNQLLAPAMGNMAPAQRSLLNALIEAERQRAEQNQAGRR